MGAAGRKGAGVLEVRKQPKQHFECEAPDRHFELHARNADLELHTENADPELQAQNVDLRMQTLALDCDLIVIRTQSRARVCIPPKTQTRLGLLKDCTAKPTLVGARARGHETKKDTHIGFA